MAASGWLEIKVSGTQKVEANAAKLRPDAKRAMTKEKRRLAKNLAAKMRRAVLSKTKKRHGRPMGARVRPTIRQAGEHVIAGPHPMLYGTEYGMNSKSGWYNEPQFANSTELQYFRHQNDGYWWRPTILRSKPEMDEAVARVADDVVRHWN